MPRRLAATMLALVLIVPLVGCATAWPTDWTGHHIDGVIKKFGPPKRTIPRGERTMYVWEVEWRMVNPPTTDPTTGSVIPSAQSAVASTSVRSFLVGGDGIIVSFTWQD